MVTTPGLHHVTAIGGDPERNAAFHVDTLGLWLVKRTVNHDDTDTYPSTTATASAPRGRT